MDIAFAKKLGAAGYVSVCAAVWIKAGFAESLFTFGLGACIVALAVWFEA